LAKSSVSASWKAYFVALPFGLTLPVSVAPVSVTSVAAPVMATGAQNSGP
jgi:hypothetical protein